MAAVQDVSHLPTTSKGCLEGGTGRLPPWPALLPSEANARVIFRSLCCGRGTGPGTRAPGPPGAQACRPLPQTVSLSHPQSCALPSALGGALCSFLLRVKLLKQFSGFSFVPLSLAHGSLASVPEGLSPPLNCPVPVLCFLGLRLTLVLTLHLGIRPRTLQPSQKRPFPPAPLH